MTRWLLPCLSLAIGGGGCLPASAVGIDADGDGAVSMAQGGADCDDSDPSSHPSASENCDGRDNDCDGTIDEEFLDADGSGVPDCRDTERCDGDDNDGDGRIDEGFSDVDGNGRADCVDVERCDGLDNDGDGQIDEGFDEDGKFGPDCIDDDGDGYSEEEDDCNDGSTLQHEGWPYDVRDEVDNDCDRLDDEVNVLDHAPGWMLGEQAADQAGFAVIDAGDVDGDGLHDLLVSARQAGRETAGRVGRVYLVPGGTMPIGRSYLEAEAVASWEGVSANEEAGTTLAAVGDIQGDGFDDFLVGAHLAGFGGQSSAGVVYLVAGRSGAFPGALLSEVASARFIGRVASDNLGLSMAGIGDFNGDGYPDFALAAPGANVIEGNTTVNDVGEVYLFLGRPGGFTGDLPVSAASITFRGPAQTNGFGRSVAGAGDVDGDGFDDLLIGDPYADPGGLSNAGAAWLIRGGSSLSGLYRLDGTDGVPFATFTGLTATDAAGTTVAGPGDLDGDGYAEMLIASPSSTTTGGQLYLFYGSNDLTGGVRSLVEADVTLGQSNAGQLGQGMSTGGDVDGDGFPDFLVHAPGPTVPVGDIPSFYYLLRGGRPLEPGLKLDLEADVAFSSSYPAGLGALELFRSSSALIDLDGDGQSEMVIAVPRAAENTLNDPGTVYVYPGY